MNRINVLFNALIILLMITFVVLAVKVNAQTVGEIYADEDGAYLMLGTDAELPATKYTYIASENGGYTINITWHLSADNPFVPERGTNKEYVEAFLNYDLKGGIGGIDLVVLDKEEIPDGNSESTDVQTRLSIDKKGRCQAVIQFKNNG